MRVTAFHKLLGVAFILILLAGVWFTYAVFSKKFTSYDEVKLETSNIGLQLPSRADVKIRGVIVGEVLDFSANAEGAELTLGIYPSQIDTIPENVTASIVPRCIATCSAADCASPNRKMSRHTLVSSTTLVMRSCPFTRAYSIRP